MAVLYVTDRDGKLHELNVTEGCSLMEVLRDAGLPVAAICGGQCICSTCHVYVAPEWNVQLKPRAPDEQAMVEDSGHYRENSRLACQIEFEAPMDGIELVLAPEF